MQISKWYILHALALADLTDAPLWDYSGRGMQGRTSFGFVGTIDDYTSFILGLVDVVCGDTEDFDMSLEIAEKFGKKVQTDSMGLDTLYYFPGVEVLED